jgi:MFS family permease
VVVVLTAAYIVSFIDRQILALLVVPIQRDLGLSDTQMGLLLGPSFAVFFALFGIPIGRLADRGTRRNIVAVGIAAWCAMTALCGLARNCLQLLVARIGVGVGEATLGPCALSLISDYFPAERRARPLGFYAMGVSVGSALALLIGGKVVAWVFAAPSLLLPLLGELRAWQAVFLVVGAPGLLMSLLMLTVREPPRREVLHAPSSPGHAVADHAAVRRRAMARLRWPVARHVRRRDARLRFSVVAADVLRAHVGVDCAADCHGAGPGDADRRAPQREWRRLAGRPAFRVGPDRSCASSCGAPS